MQLPFHLNDLEDYSYKDYGKSPTFKLVIDAGL